MDPRTRAWLETIAVTLLLGLFLWWSYPGREHKITEEITSTSTPLFIAPAIEAKAAIVYDAQTGRTIFEHNADESLPLASLTKLMTAYTAYGIVPRYLLVRVTADDVREEGDTGLYTDEEWDLGSLIDFSLIVSSNDGARAIASVAGAQLIAAATSTPIESTPTSEFIEHMNIQATKLGLSSMHFYNYSGLDITTTQAGGYGSARDVTKLLKKILDKDPHIVEATALNATVIDSKIAAHPAGNTNKALPDIPGAIASKTGYTDLSGGNLTVAFDAGLGHPIIVTVLGSSYDGRFTDMSALVKATINYLATTSQSVAQ
ncbi:MAG TPA: serine hydrolase [Candidatus Paceibacterota bacterium]